MACVQGFLPIVGFFISLVGFSYVFLNQLVADEFSMMFGIILILTSSALILTFLLIKYQQCKNPNDTQQSSTFEQDKVCFMKLWNAPKDWHCAFKALYYGTLMPFIIFIMGGLLLGVVIYFTSGILIFYLIIKYCADKKKSKREKSKYESDSNMEVVSNK